MANLTPEQLARLRQMMQQGGQAEYYDEATGRSYGGNNNSGWTPGTAGLSGQDDQQAAAPSEIWGYDWAPGMYSDNFELNGKPYDRFNPETGEFIGQGTFTGLKKNSAMGTMLPFLMAAAPFALSMFPSLGAAASFGTNPVLSGASATGFAPGAAGAVGGAGYGALGATEPIASIGASGGMTQAELAAMGAGGSGVGTMAPLATIEGPMSSSLLADSLAPVGGAAGAAKYLGPAATLLGGLAGAQGQKTEQTSERKTDPRVDPYLFGANGQPGLLAMTYDKLRSQMAPGGLQGYDDMQRVGMGLLNAPVAGNGFGLFTRGKY